MPLECLHAMCTGLWQRPIQNIDSKLLNEIRATHTRPVPSDWELHLPYCPLSNS